MPALQWFLEMSIGFYLTESEGGEDKSIFSSDNYLGLRSLNLNISSLVNPLKVVD